uniref:Uncharacterized protein n=1 Tax=Trichogramma kaykai TaxID=54128 RepID=A0ABD2WAC6_9HYME
MREYMTFLYRGDEAMPRRTDVRLRHILQQERGDGVMNNDIELVIPNKPQLVMERIDEKLSQLTSAYNKMANHINCMDTNCENMWLKIKTIEQTMEFMMEQLECVTKHVSDINVNMKLRNEEEREQAEANKNRD